MTIEEFKQIRSKYKTDKECYKTEKINQKEFYKLKQEAGLTKRSKKDKLYQKELTKLTKEEFLKIREQYSSNEECAKALNIGKDAFYTIQKQIGNITKIYDHSEINKEEFLKYYNKGLNDIQIAKKLNTTDGRIFAFREKLQLPNNLKKQLTFTDEQYQIFIGGMFGDSCLYYPSKKSACFSFSHALKQKNYALWKYEKLKPLCFKPYFYKEYDKRNDNVYEGIKIVSYTNQLFASYGNRFYKTINHRRVKYINKELLYSLTDLGVAIWFMDDGYKMKSGGYCFSTNCFSDEDLQLIQQFFLEKYNIRTTIHKSHVLYISAKDQILFTNLVKPYIHKDCLYKLHNCPG